MNRLRAKPILVAFAIAALAAFAYRGAHVARADVDPQPCPGNVCSGSIVVGGQTMQYAYTEHVSPNGELRVRLNGGVYNTNTLISTIIHGLPQFVSWDKLANPSNGAVYLPTEDVNPGRTAYERRDDDGCVGCIVDQVMSVKFSGLAPGTYPYSLSVVQGGDTGGKTFTLYVDAAAPDTTNESSVWNAIGLGFPCADHIDNDLDYKTDCADPQCIGSIGDAGTSAVCEQPESTCNDGFDNDANGKADCLDPACDGHIGQPGGTALCQFGNEHGAATCNDHFDNDGDGLQDCVDNVATDNDPANTCWKQDAYGCPSTEISCTDNVDNDKDQNYSDAYDAVPTSGIDCTDYDCANHPGECPTAENMDKDGVQHDEQCFDGKDNDLDHYTDCSDQDCAGVIDPLDPTKVCRTAEFEPHVYQFCSNQFDDNGDDLPNQPGSRTDCNDASCSRQFGNCGPCPTVEDFTWNACADGKDNDTDQALAGGGVDCGDPDCVDQIGTTSNAALCSAAENSDALCGDGFDNDLNGKTDCADASCAGHTGPQGQVCQPAGESGAGACADGKDNDADGLIDCADPGCWGTGSCPAQDWTVAACTVVPRDSAPTAFTSNDPTILATVRLATHVSQGDVIRLTGSAAYSSVTVIVGDNTDPSKYYPYAAAGPGCTLSGPSAARFDFTAVAGHALQIYNLPGPDINTFDITLTCATPGTPALVKDYPISLSALKSPSGTPEYGDVDFSTTLYEATPPTVLGIQAEGESGGTVHVAYGGTVHWRGVPDDGPGGPPTASGICSCGITVDAATYSTDGNCVAATPPFYADAVITPGAVAQDGADNVSAPFTSPVSFNVDVTPALEAPGLALSPSQPFFKDGQMTASIEAHFITGSTDDFGPIGSTCEAILRDDSGTQIGAPIPFTAVYAGFEPEIHCSGQVDLPTVPQDGRYFLTVRVTDGDGDALESNRKTVYVCNVVPGPGDPPNDCRFADFDGDGVPEGTYSAPGFYGPAPLSCDNCVGLYNPVGLTEPSQADTNANGIGDACEPTQVYGRCEVDAEIVCKYDSDYHDATVSCPEGELCCPGPSVGERLYCQDDATPCTQDSDCAGVDLSFGPPACFSQHKIPQKCITQWGVCSIGGAVCFEDVDCTAGPTPKPNGYGVCQDNSTACKRDADCPSAPGQAKCTGANVCDTMAQAWLETLHGSIFSGKSITSTTRPPKDKFNATFCITAKGYVTNFSSQDCGITTGSQSALALPQQSNSYTTVLGSLDLAGLRSGKYGPVVEVASSSDLAALLLNATNGLGGKVYHLTGDVSVPTTVFHNGGSGSGGAGTIFVDGGNLRITGDLTYDTATAPVSLAALASVGWIVTGDGSATGNITVDGGVTDIVGAFYAAGEFKSVTPEPGNPPVTTSSKQLTVRGLAAARNFTLTRTFKSQTEGAERFIYDGRAVANPPPGFADVTKSLPAFSDALPQ